MMQSDRISITTLLIAITVAMFGNGMLMIHNANAMYHENVMGSSSNNVMCKASGCMQEHGTCETHCVSVPTTQKQTKAATPNQNLEVSDTAEILFTVPIIDPPYLQPTSHKLQPPILRYIKTVIKRE